MSQIVPATAVLGAGQTGLSIGYRVLDIDRVQYSAFSTTGVVETSTPGTYSKAGGVIAPSAGGYIIWGTIGEDLAEDEITPSLLWISSGAPGSGMYYEDLLEALEGRILVEPSSVTNLSNLSSLTVIQTVTLNRTISNLVISATWAKVYWTLKESIYDDDEMAIIQIVESNPGAGTDGLLYLDSAAIVAPITVADGTLTVNQAGGIVTIAVTDNATALLNAASGLVWDIKTKDAAGNTVQNTTGTASIVRAVTQTI